MLFYMNYLILSIKIIVRISHNFITIFMPDWKERKKILDEEFMGVV